METKTGGKEDLGGGFAGAPEDDQGDGRRG